MTKPYTILDSITALLSLDSERSKKAARSMFLDLEHELFETKVKKFELYTLEGRLVNLSNFPKTFAKVPAIKAIRYIFNIGLKDAKDFVEQYNLFCATDYTNPSSVFKGVVGEIPRCVLEMVAKDNGMQLPN